MAACCRHDTAKPTAVLIDPSDAEHESYPDDAAALLVLRGGEWRHHHVGMGG